MDISRLRSGSVAAIVTLLAACGGGGGGGSGAVPFQPTSTSMSFGGNLPVQFSGGMVAFLGDEATTGPGGTDFNGNGNALDTIPMIVDTLTGVETMLFVAALNCLWSGTQLYLIVDEGIDGRNWETIDTGDQIVLLTWAAPAVAPTFVAALADDTVVSIEPFVYYASLSVTPTMPMESNLRQITVTTDPIASDPVSTTDTTGPLEPNILGHDNGLIFLGLNEVNESRDLNGDGDSLDLTVVALLDGTAAGEVLRNTGLAALGDAVPYAAAARGSGDWIVGFLVNELAQGATNLNDPALFSVNWQPTQCTGPDDTDTDDDVLHYLEFAAWNLNPVTDPIRNTGVVGETRVVAIASTGSFVGTLTQEFNDGACDLNEDGLADDLVFRWVAFVPDPDPILPVVSGTLMHAVTDTPGGTHGVTVLSNRWVVIVDEANDGADYDMSTFDSDLLAWYDPQSVATDFTFMHNVNVMSPFAGVTWMGTDRTGSFIPCDFREDVAMQNLNGSGGDTDMLDAIDAIAFFDGSSLRFSGVSIATQLTNAGVISNDGWILYRADETDDSRDWNGDGDTSDLVLIRSRLPSTGSTFTTQIDTLPSLARPVVDFDSANPASGSYIGSEPETGIDFNGDGDTLDNVLRWFRF